MQFGSNENGELGIGNNNTNLSLVYPVKNEDLSDILKDVWKIEAGDKYTVAVLIDGKVLTWGNAQDKRLGTEEDTNQNKPTENTNIGNIISNIGAEPFIIDAGKSHVAIGLANGDVYTWGTGENGELGNEEYENKSEPQKVGEAIIKTNTNHLVLNENETFDIDGSITYFNLIKDINTNISFESKDEDIIIIDENTGIANAIKAGKGVIIAKENRTNIIGVIQVRVLPQDINIVTSVKTKGNHTITLKSNGTVWSYGQNSNGELGNGKTEYSDDPIQALFSEGTVITQIDCGENFSAALDNEGNVWVWGSNSHMQLGRTGGVALIPEKVKGLSKVTKIACRKLSLTCNYRR